MECPCERHEASSGLEPREKNSCKRAMYAWVLCGVYTPRRLLRNRHCMQAIHHALKKKKKRSHHFDVCDHEENCHADV